jgi:nucleotide-binding universal stress UspA family protein
VYDRVLIYVDHKKSLEASLPFLEAELRRKIAREAVLASVVRPCDPTLFGYVLDPAEVAAIDAHNLAEADEFLARAAARLAGSGISLRTQVLVGDPNDTFASFAAGGGFDLVVVAPTGRRYLLTGKSRAFRRALRRIAMPVMILPALSQHARAA